MPETSSSADNPGAFDPYHKWLGIPTKEQPPHHYRLLGVNLFEADSDVIEAAANRQSAFLRQYATGPHGEHSQKLLNEVSEAQICLLVPEQKQKYDKSLRDKIAAIKAKAKPAAKKPAAAKQTAKPDSIFKDDDDDEGGTYAVSESKAKKPKVATKPKEEKMSDADIQSFYRLSQQCIEKHDYSQAVELLSGIPRSQRSAAVQKLYEKSVRLDQKCEELTAEMNDAYSLQDYAAAFAAAKQLLKLKPGHRGARDIAREISQNGLLKTGKRQQPRARKKGGIPPVAIKLAVASLVIGGVVWGGMALMNGMNGDTTGGDDNEQAAEFGTVRFQVDDAFRKANLTILIDGKEHMLSDLESGVELAVGKHPLQVKDGKRVVHKRNIAVDPNNEPVITLSYDGGKVDGMSVVELENEPLKLPDGDEGEVREFKGHDGDIRDLTFSPNGRYLASASNDRTARLWNVETGAEIRAFEPGYYASSASFSPDGKWIALTGDRTNTFRVWDLKTGLAVKEFVGHTAPVSSVAYSPDGTLIASASNTGPDGGVRLWNAVTATEIWKFAVHKRSANTVSFSPDGKQVLAVIDGNVMTIDAETGERLRLFDGTGPASFSADGSVVLTKSNTQTPQIWNAATGVEVRTLPDLTYVAALAFSSTGPFAAFSTNNRNDTSIAVLNTETGKQIAKFEGHKSSVYRLAFTPDGRFLASGGRDKSIRLWRLPNTATDTSAKFETLATTVESLPDGPVGEVRTFNGAGANPGVSDDGLYVVTTHGGFAKVWNIDTGELIFKSFQHDAFDALISNDARYVVSAGRTTLHIWEIATGKELQRIAVPGTAIGAISLSADNRRLLASVTLDRSLDSRVGVLFDLPAGNELRRFPAEDAVGIRQAVLSENGEHIAALDLSRKSARIFDAETGATLHTLPLLDDEKAAINGNVKMRFSPEGSELVVTGTDQITRLFSIETGKQVAAIPVTSSISGLDLSPVGSQLLTAGTEIRLYSRASNRFDSLFGDAGKTVRSIQFVPGGKYAVSTGSDYAMRVWRLPTISWPEAEPPDSIADLDVEPPGDEIRSFQAHDRGVKRIVFGPDGNIFASISTSDANVRLWDVAAASKRETFKTDYSGVGGVAFGKNGESLITGQTSGSILDWSVSTGNKTTWSKHPSKSISDMAVSPDGKFLVTASAQDAGSLRLWDIAKADEKWRYELSQQTASSIAFTTDGTKVFAEIDGVVMLLDANEGKRIRIFDGTGPAALTPDSRFAVTSGPDTLRLWDTETGREVQRFRGFAALPSSLAFSPDGRYLVAVQDRTARLRLFDVPSGMQVLQRRIRGEGAISAVSFAPNQDLVAYGTANGTIGLWTLPPIAEVTAPTDGGVGSPGSIAIDSAAEPTTGEIGRIALPGYYPTAPTVSADGRFAGVIHNYTAKAWNLETGELIFKSSTDRNRVEGIAISNDASVILTRTQAGVDRWDTATGQRNICVAVPYPQRLAIAPNGKSVVIFTSQRKGRKVTTALYEVASGTKTFSLPINSPTRTPRARFSKDGTQIAIVDGNSVKLFDAATGNMKKELPGPKKGFNWVPIFSDDGERLYTYGSDREITTWTLSDGKVYRKTKLDRLNPIAVGSDSTFVARSQTGLTLHSMGKADEIGSINSILGRTTHLRYALDGTFAVSTGDDNTLRTWKLPARRGGAGR